MVPILVSRVRGPRGDPGSVLDSAPAPDAAADPRGAAKSPARRRGNIRADDIRPPNRRTKSVPGLLAEQVNDLIELQFAGNVQWCFAVVSLHVSLGTFS